MGRFHFSCIFIVFACMHVTSFCSVSPRVARENFACLCLVVTKNDCGIHEGLKYYDLVQGGWVETNPWEILARASNNILSGVKNLAPKDQIKGKVFASAFESATVGRIKLMHEADKIASNLSNGVITPRKKSWKLRILRTKFNKANTSIGLVAGDFLLTLRKGTADQLCRRMNDYEKRTETKLDLLRSDATKKLYRIQKSQKMKKKFTNRRAKQLLKKKERRHLCLRPERLCSQLLAGTQQLNSIDC